MTELLRKLKWWIIDHTWRRPGLYWHQYHSTLLGYCCSYGERVDTIRRYKPKSERPTRLRLFQPVRGKLPKEITRALTQSSQGNWRQLCLKYTKELTVLHKKECPNCPWDGKTIFPEGG